MGIVQLSVPIYHTTLSTQQPSQRKMHIIINPFHICYSSFDRINNIQQPLAVVFQGPKLNDFHTKFDRKLSNFLIF
jgi:hypothetical protein